MAVPLTARAPIPFTPRSLSDRNAELVKQAKEPISIIVRVPTMYERDAFQAALVRGGVVHYSRKQIRDLMLAGITHLYPPERFDELRGDLEELWAVGDAQQKCEMDRTDLYIQMIERNSELVKKGLPPHSEEEMEKELALIQPTAAMDEARRVRITAVQQDIQSRYEPMQKAFADLAEQDIRRDWLCVETYVVNWKGLEHAPEGNGRGGLTRHEAEYLRSGIGTEAFNQLGEFILAMHSIDGDEEKNLASLIENTSGPIGSTVPEAMKRTPNGPSTDAPSTETPVNESPTTTAPSSKSTRRSKTKTEPSAPSPMAAAS